MMLNMEIVKIAGIGIVALIIIMILKQYRPEFVIYVSLIAGVMILVLIMDKLSGIINLLTNLSNKMSINQEFLKVLIKITGIAFLTEFAVSICKDSGETAIASKVDLGRESNYYFIIYSHYYFFIRNNSTNIAMILE